MHAHCAAPSQRARDIAMRRAHRAHTRAHCGATARAVRAQAAPIPQYHYRPNHRYRQLCARQRRARNTNAVARAVCSARAHNPFYCAAAAQRCAASAHAARARNSLPICRRYARAPHCAHCRSAPCARALHAVRRCAAPRRRARQRHAVLCTTCTCSALRRSARAAARRKAIFAAPFSVRRRAPHLPHRARRSARAVYTAQSTARAQLSTDILTSGARAPAFAPSLRQHCHTDNTNSNSSAAATVRRGAHRRARARNLQRRPPFGAFGGARAALSNYRHGAHIFSTDAIY